MSEERFADVGRGIRLCYTETGDPDGRPLVLVAGLGQQLISWPEGFVELLAGRGYRVVTFDNRDAGRSTHADYRPPSLPVIFSGRIPAYAYHLGDLARDTVGLLDALGIDSAHLAGASMGGMIAQTAAVHFPHRVRTLTSIMSTTGARRVGRPALSTWALLAGRPPRTRDEAVVRDLRIFRHIGSHGFPFDEAAVRATAAAAWERDRSSAGAGRHLAAIYASGDRTRGGCPAATVCAIIPPIDTPTRCASSMPSASSSPTVSAAMSAMSYCSAGKRPNNIWPGRAGR